MTVVVDHGLVADTLYIHAWPGGAERAEANGDAEDPVGLCPDRHERRNFAVARQAWKGHRLPDLRRAAGQARSGNSEEITSVHQACSQNRVGELESGSSWSRQLGRK